MIDDISWNEELEKEYREGNFPKWPNEIMLKIIFGRYLTNRFKVKDGLNVLDIGCFSGNNLFPFAEKECNCYGVDIHEGIISLAKKIFDSKGYQGKFKVGTNTSLPFEDNYFDILLSVSTIHYEQSKSNLIRALEEFRRVLKPKGKFYINTVGPQHDIKNSSKKLSENIYEIRDYDFRDGQKFYFYEDEEEIHKDFNKLFSNLEIGRVTEKLMNQKLDFFIITGEK